ncbi:sugar phosphate nucleotidyltransferase [Bacteroidota bacterium]
MNDRLVILAGGMSSRMKKAIDQTKDVDSKLLDEAASKPKSMIGVGKGSRPFMDYLLFNALRAGYTDVVIVVNNKDTAIKEHYGQKDSGNKFYDLSLSYAYQIIPDGRTKPLGTADAMTAAMDARPDWKGQKFTVCNSDNLYSVEALKLLQNPEYPNALIDYDRSALQFEESRIKAFAVTEKDKEGFMQKIIEKPTEEDVKSVTGANGYIGVSMNIWRFDYDMVYSYMKDVPMHPERNEEELPTAVMNMIKDNPKAVYAIPLSEHVPDLTNPADIKTIVEYLQEEYKEFD